MSDCLNIEFYQFLSDKITLSLTVVSMQFEIKLVALGSIIQAE